MYQVYTFDSRNFFILGMSVKESNIQMNIHSTIWELQGAHMEVLVIHEELGATS